MKSDPGRNSYCMRDAHEAIITMEDYVRVQKEIELRTKKKRKHESSASALIDEINWPEPQNAARASVPEPAQEINWPEPER